MLGYSFGGALAQQLAHDQPRRVRRLILAGTSAGMVSVPAAPARARPDGDAVRYYSPRHLRRVASIDRRRPDRARAARSLDAARRGPHLGSAVVARLPVAARRDHRVDERALAAPAQLSRRWCWPATTIRSCRWPTPASSPAGSPARDCTSLRGGGHLFLLDQPRDVVDVVGAFLADPPRSRNDIRDQLRGPHGHRHRRRRRIGTSLRARARSPRGARGRQRPAPVRRRGRRDRQPPGARRSPPPTRSARARVAKRSSSARSTRSAASTY